MTYIFTRHIWAIRQTKEGLRFLLWRTKKKTKKQSVWVTRPKQISCQMKTLATNEDESKAPTSLVFTPIFTIYIFLCSASQAAHARVMKGMFIQSHFAILRDVSIHRFNHYIPLSHCSLRPFRYKPSFAEGWEENNGFTWSQLAAGIIT